MGSFFVNFHVRSKDDDAVREAASVSGAVQFHVAPPRRGWVSVYEQRASTQDDKAIVRLATELSSRLQTACIAFLVHDSDIACYWLMDRGEMRDEYNSDPGYFEQPITAAEQERVDAESEHVRGKPEVFLEYCQPGVTRDEVEAALRSEDVFAEDIIQQLAGFLGIGPERALRDFKDAADLGDEDDEAAEPTMRLPRPKAKLLETLQQQMAAVFGTSQEQATTPQGNALVEAAAAGNLAEIDRLVSAGADVNAPGLLPFEPFAATTLGGPSGMVPKLAISPLLAAASRGKAAAVQHLLRHGANLNEKHPMYGSALHVAAQSGSLETVELLLAAGIPANLKSAQGHSPRDLIDALRKQLEMLKMMAEAMPQMQQMHQQMIAQLEAGFEAGWDACDEALRKAGG